jgi:hypothetical protein
MAGEELGRMIAARLDEIVRDYTEQLGDIREKLGEERALRRVAENTLREGMAEERLRRERAEQERDQLRWELAAIRAGREIPEGVEAAPVSAQAHPDVAGSQTAAQPPQRKTLRDLTRSLFRR